MTNVNIKRLGDSYAIDFSAECVEFIYVHDIIELLFNMYDKHGTVKDGENFTVTKIEFHGHFKIRR